MNAVVYAVAYAQHFSIIVVTTAVYADHLCGSNVRKVLICYAPYTFVKIKMCQNLFSAYALTPNSMQKWQICPLF